MPVKFVLENASILMLPLSNKLPKAINLLLFAQSDLQCVRYDEFVVESGWKPSRPDLRANFQSLLGILLREKMNIRVDDI